MAFVSLGVPLILAGVGFLYPEIKKTAFDFRHARANGAVIDARRIERGNERGAAAGVAIAVFTMRSWR